MENDKTPKNNPAISIPAAIITGAVIIAIALLVVLKPNVNSVNNPINNQKAPSEDSITEVPKDVATIRDNDHVMGDPTKVQVAIIEYSDSDCPFCAKFHPTVKTIYEEYEGKVAIVYRHFPLESLHPNASTEAVALECVAELGGNEAFYKYLDTIIDVTLSPSPKSNEALVTYASAQGIDSDLFKKCMASSAPAERVKSDYDEAQRIGAKGTPFVIAVNLKSGNQVIVPGAYPIEHMRQVVDSLLK